MRGRGELQQLPKFTPPKFVLAPSTTLQVTFPSHNNNFLPSSNSNSTHPSQHQLHLPSAIKPHPPNTFPIPPSRSTRNILSLEAPAHTSLDL
jgi:hypothetical protein